MINKLIGKANQKSQGKWMQVLEFRRFNCEGQQGIKAGTIKM